MKNEKPRPASGAKILFSVLLAAFMFWVIATMPDGDRLQAFLYLIVGTYFLILFSQLFFKYRKNSMTGAYVLLTAGGIFMLLFVIRLFNLLLILLNPLILSFGPDFQFGHLFPGIYDFVFSFPSFICGLILLVTGYFWENKNPKVSAIKDAFLSGK
jgi:hypothetical protein